MKVLITGANGFVGSALTKNLLQQNWQVVAAVRKQCGDKSQIVIGEIDGGTQWQDALHACQTVVHLAARVHIMRDMAAVPLAAFRVVNTEGTLNLARQASRAGVQRFIFLSTIKVNGEATAPNNSFRASDTPAPIDAYAQSKYEAECGLLQLAKETGMEVVIIRPPLVYGPMVKGNFASLIHWIRMGIPLPLGAVDNRRSLVALDNLISLITLCANRERSPSAANEVFLVSDDDDVSTTELLRRVAHAYGKTAHLLPAPIPWLKMAAKLFGKTAETGRLLDSLVVDSIKTRDLLQWYPVTSMHDQLQKMACADARLESRHPTP